MSDVTDSLTDFLDYARLLKGDEKGEAQVFCDRLFQAFGHDGYKEAGAELEFRIRKKSTKGTSFADLVWKPRRNKQAADICPAHAAAARHQYNPQSKRPRMR